MTSEDFFKSVPRSNNIADHFAACAKRERELRAEGVAIEAKSGGWRVRA